MTSKPVAEGQRTLLPESSYDLATGAVYSPCKTYRYTLKRTWAASKPVCCFCALNPSTATEFELDPTCTRMRDYAEQWGFGTLYVVNAFALRQTDPKLMMQHPEPVGPENDMHILKTAASADLLVVAWGNDGAHLGRSEHLTKLLTHAGIPMHALHITGTGEPGHPLYLKRSLTPQPYRGRSDIGAAS